MENIMTRDLSIPQNLGNRLEETLEKLKVEFNRVLRFGFEEDNEFYLHLGDIRCIAKKIKNAETWKSDG